MGGCRISPGINFAPLYSFITLQDDWNIQLIIYNRCNYSGGHGDFPCRVGIRKRVGCPRKILIFSLLFSLAE